MRGREVGRTGAWRGALAGAACGALATALYYLYYEVTSPTPYNVILLFNAPVFMTFGGMAGLLVWAMRDSQMYRRGPAPPWNLHAATAEGRGESLTSERKRPSFWRGPIIGAACGALITLLYLLYLELTHPSAYARFVVLTYGFVLTIFCAVAGLVFGATPDSD